MDLHKKKQKADRYISKLKMAAEKFLLSKKYEACLETLHALSYFLYEYNQYYIDEDIEKMLLKVSEALNLNKDNVSDSIPNKVLLLDGFTFETRGVIWMYLNALVKGGFDIVYLCDGVRIGEIPSIIDYCKNHNIKVATFNGKSPFVDMAKDIVNVFLNEKPSKALFYTYPYDVSGYVAFASVNGISERFLIDLTDHAFWIGKYCNDYFCGSREMSAYIQHFERKIPKNQLIKLGVNLIVKKVDNHNGLPFDVTSSKFIFSGGALYKTLGDPNDYYYKIVDYILANHDQIKFLFAGYGDDSKMKLIVDKYPDRAFYIAEREDYYYLMEKCLFYLNTYPMFGGMMMKYSALAGKLPITLKHNADSDGLLLHQKELDIEYDSYEDLIKDVDRLIDDDEYRGEREKKLKGSVITEERFVNNLKSALNEHHTDYEHVYEYFDTSKFRNEYLERHNFRQATTPLLNGDRHPCFIKLFPIRYICYNLLRKIKHLLRK